MSKLGRVLLFFPSSVIFPTFYSLKKNYIYIQSHRHSCIDMDVSTPVSMPLGVTLPTNARAATGGASAAQVSGLDSGAGRSRDPGRLGRRAQRHLGRGAPVQVLLRSPAQATLSPRPSWGFLLLPRARKT